MMDLLERFVNYVRIDTKSDEYSETAPSTMKQFDLARVLVKELEELGLSDVVLSDTCVVYGKLPANTDAEADRIGFVSHMDTSPAFSGTDVKPKLVRNYKGGAILLNKELNIVLDPEQFPSLKKDIGDDLIVTDGTTLLGADDKAGIAEIMDMLQYLQQHPEIPHGQISVAFTPDEEVGRGVENFDLEQFGADYAYTVDGGDADELCYECFNAASADVTVNGLSVHPGGAKGKMLNSLLVAMEFQSLLPTFANPMYTEGREGFNHLNEMDGGCETSHMHYIIRNHDSDLLEKQKEDFHNAADFLNKKYGPQTIELVIKDTYRNMREKIEQHPQILDKVREKMQKLGLEPKSSAARGGTDGASLTVMGLPCPNLGTGGRNCHGKYEYAAIGQMRTVVKLLVEIARID